MSNDRRITPRQEQVAQLIAAGFTNEEVGDQLAISPRTAKAHGDALRERLGVARRRHIPAAYRAYVESLHGDPRGGR